MWTNCTATWERVAAICENFNTLPDGAVEKKLRRRPRASSRKVQLLQANTRFYVTNYIKPRPVIVPWSSLHHARLTFRELFR
jgi:hypothetical protein